MSTGAQLKVLLDGSSGFYFGDKKVVSDINNYLKKNDPDLLKQLLPDRDKELKIGRNYPAALLDGASEADRDARQVKLAKLSERLSGMVEAKAHGGEALAKNLFAAARFPDGDSDGKLTRGQVESKLYAAYAPAHNPDTDAATLVASPMLKGHPATREPGFKKLGAQEQLTAISAKNLEGLASELDKYQKLFAADPKLATYDKLVGAASEDVWKRYGGGLATHATNGDIASHILPTADRHAIQGFAKGLTGDTSRAAKVTHTSDTNTQHLATHDYAFFNVYPQTNDALKREMLGATRYLRETPEVASSAMAAKAQSFTFGLGDFTAPERLSVMTLRDPVYPAGGTTAADARKRMEGADGFATYGGAEPSAGKAKRHFGAEVDEYETSSRLFAGQDAKKALTMNVHVGLYKTYYGLYQDVLANSSKDPTSSGTSQEGEAAREKRLEQAKGKLERFSHLVNDITAGPRPKTDGQMETAEDCSHRQDKAALAAIKLYQYPQLMVSGPVDISRAEKFTPTQGLERAPTVAQVAPAETQVQAGNEQTRRAITQ